MHAPICSILKGGLPREDQKNNPLFLAVSEKMIIFAEQFETTYETIRSFPVDDSMCALCMGRQ
jgi:hypothetical protein